MLLADLLVEELERIGVETIVSKFKTTRQLNDILGKYAIPVVTNKPLEDIVDYSLTNGSNALLDYANQNVLESQLQSVLRQYSEGVDNALTRLLRKQMSRDYDKLGPVYTCGYLNLAHKVGVNATRLYQFCESTLPATLIYYVHCPENKRKSIIMREARLACSSPDRFKWLTRSTGTTSLYVSGLRVVVTCATLTTCFDASSSLTEFKTRFDKIMSVFTDEEDEDRMDQLFMAIAYVRAVPEDGANYSPYDKYFKNALIYCEVVYGTDLIELLKYHSTDPTSLQATCVKLLFGRGS